MVRHEDAFMVKAGLKLFVPDGISAPVFIIL